MHPVRDCAPRLQNNRGRYCKTTTQWSGTDSLDVKATAYKSSSQRDVYEELIECKFLTFVRKVIGVRAQNSFVEISDDVNNNFSSGLTSEGGRGANG